MRVLGPADRAPPAVLGGRLDEAERLVSGCCAHAHLDAADRPLGLRWREISGMSV